MLFPAARADRSKAMNKRADIFDAMIERLRPESPGVFAASLDGLPREAVALAMNAADAVVITSMWEGAPVVVKEALGLSYPGRLGSGRVTSPPWSTACRDARSPRAIPRRWRRPSSRH